MPGRAPRYHAITKLTVVTLFFLVTALFWFDNGRRGQMAVAVAKGQQLFAAGSVPVALNTETARAIALADDEVATLLTGKSYDFVNAIPLTASEAGPWHDAGCDSANCAHIIFYDYSDGGTINAIVNAGTARVIDRWREPAARPAGSPSILEKAVAIAAAEPQVRTVLSDIGAGDPLMVPMSGWLADDDCRQDWCVDLTYHDPAGSGRIFHVFVNLVQEKVARTFYTRGRADLDVAMPDASQRNVFTDGCHEQYGWSVCWEMTAHDGINFSEATYEGTSVFASAKIGQIEAWYPSWPGGYRDEIGFNASVPPFGDTQVNDLGDSFEVRQLFTEFTRWPNCICCYRYEEIIRFYADGAFELRFVSHGPGCDDLSIYRPFWRINLALDGPNNDQVWVWQEAQWVESRREQEVENFVEDLSPNGYKIATIDGDASYRWRLLPTDPLGLDEARFFVLQNKEMEGEGPIATGPGDTYQPPRQWLDGEAASGRDVALWFVPSLKTKKSDPVWCKPDPEPGINQCEAILRVEPAGELRQPTAEELAQLTPAVVPTPTTSTTPEGATPMASPTPRPVEGEDAQTIILNAGCGSCHAIADLGEGHKVGPDLTNIGTVAGNRIAGVSAEAYLRQSILDPHAFIAPECPAGPCLPGVMPGDYSQRLTPAQIDILVDFLLAQRGEPAEPISTIGAGAPQPATAVPKAFPGPQKGGPSQVGPTPIANAPALWVQLLLLCIVFFLSLFRLLKQPKDS